MINRQAPCSTLNKKDGGVISKINTGISILAGHQSRVLTHQEQALTKGNSPLCSRSNICVIVLHFNREIAWANQVAIIKSEAA